MMYSAISLAWKDIQVFLKDRGAGLQLFLLPLVFVAAVMMSSVEPASEAEEEVRPSLSVVNLDGRAAAQSLLDNLNTEVGVAVVVYEPGEARTLLKEREIEHLLTIPENFTAGISNDEPVTLRLTTHPNADNGQTEAVWLAINGLANDMSLESQLFEALEQMGNMQASASEAERAFAVERMQAQARSQFELAQTRPLVTIEKREPGQSKVQVDTLEVQETIVPGITVMFVFMTAQSAASSIYNEKKTGTFRRLLAAPLSRASFLAGKMLPTFITGLIQTTVIFAFGIFGLQLLGLTPATLGKDPLATVLVVLLLALCSSALGILIAALARTESQIGGLSTLLLWGFGIVALIPAFILERFLGAGRLVIPHYWASRALVDLMVRGAGLSNVTVEMAALLGFTVLFFAVGLWRFEFDA